MSCPSRSRALPVFCVALPIAAFAELPLAMPIAVLATGAGWLLAELSGGAPLMPALAGLLIAVCANQLRVQRRPRSAIFALASSGLATGLAGAALEAGLPTLSLALVVLGSSLASGVGRRESALHRAIRVGLGALLLGPLFACLAPAVCRAATLLVCVAAAAPVFVGCWLIGRVELRLEAPAARRTFGPYR